MNQVLFSMSGRSFNDYFILGIKDALSKRNGLSSMIKNKGNRINYAHGLKVGIHMKLNNLEVI